MSACGHADNAAGSSSENVKSSSSGSTATMFGQRALDLAGFALGIPYNSASQKLISDGYRQTSIVRFDTADLQAATFSKNLGPGATDNYSVQAFRDRVVMIDHTVFFPTTEMPNVEQTVIELRQKFGTTPSLYDQNYEGIGIMRLLSWYYDSSGRPRTQNEFRCAVSPNVDAGSVGIINPMNTYRTECDSYATFKLVGDQRNPKLLKQLSASIGDEKTLREYANQVQAKKDGAAQQLIEDSKRNHAPM